MKRWLLAGVLIVGAAVALSSQAQTGADNPANPLITDKWQFRPLIVVSPSAEAPAYQSILRQVDQTRSEFDGREMMLYTVVGNEGSRHGQAMTRFETEALLKALDVDPMQGVTTLLVGKDGGKKVELRGDADLRQIYQTIDRMPMRQSGN